ncbi:hypothetical protein pipiens_014205 [Culex pipiens pipiens]|uniref:Uncharacterized protein n=1 Tax=Culex pipiens pipiens TaxID=38569 RepID=A0ABD1CW17_CULPP
MLLNLTLAAIVRGLDFAEADKIKEHTEIILSMVKNDCEALLLQESTSSANWCKLRGARSTRKSGPYRWNSRQTDVNRRGQQHESPETKLASYRTAIPLK